MAKQIRVMAIKAVVCGNTTRRLCPNVRGFSKRDDNICSIGFIWRLMRSLVRVVFCVGSMMVAVASEYRTIGEKREVVSLIR